MPVRCSTGRSNSAPASVVICPPSKRATTSREKLGANGKQDWVHSVIAKAAFSLVLTAVWKLSYPMKSGFLPDFGENSGLVEKRTKTAGRRQCFLSTSGYRARQTSARQPSQSRERPHSDFWKPIAQPHERCALAAIRLRCQCPAVRSSQIG